MMSMKSMRLILLGVCPGLLLGAPDKVFTTNEAEHVECAWRRFAYTAPEDGLYEISVRRKAWSGRIRRLLIDGLQAIYLRADDKVYPKPDALNDRSALKVDADGASTVIRPWKKGSAHTLDLYLHDGPWYWDDETGKLLPGYAFEIRRLRPDDAEPKTMFAVLGRDDLAFAKGEPLTLSVQRAAAAPAPFTLEVRESHGRVVFTKPFTATQKLAEIAYPCDREGAFEYRVFDQAGKLAEGPWEFAVVDPTPLPLPKAGRAADWETSFTPVDTWACGEGAGGTHDFRENGASEVVPYAGGSYRQVGPERRHNHGYVRTDDKKGWRRVKEGEKPMASTESCDWFGFTLHVKHPSRAHIVKALVPNDLDRVHTVVAYDPVTTEYNGWNLRSVPAPAAGAFSELKFWVWPNTNTVDILVANALNDKSVNGRSAVKSISILEAPASGIPALAEAAGGWNGVSEIGWDGEQIDLGPNERTMPPPNDASKWSSSFGQGNQGFWRGWKQFLAAWDRTGSTAMSRGDNLIVYPVCSYLMVSFQGPAKLLLPDGADVYDRGMDAENTDLFDRDIFKLMVMEASKYRVKMVADFMIQRITTNVVDFWSRRCGCSPAGALLSQGADEKPWTYMSLTGCALNPAHPAMRWRLIEFARAFGKRYGRYPGFGGLRTRFWRTWPGSFEGWFYGAEKGCDDYTVGRFVKEEKLDDPRLAPCKGDEVKFLARRAALQGEYAGRWNAWRDNVCRTLREEMLAALREGAPQAMLYSGEEPASVAAGTGLATMAGIRELGFPATVVTLEAPGRGVEWNHADPVDFAAFNHRPAPYGTLDVSRLGEANPKQNRYPCGFCVNQAFYSSPYHLRPAAEKLAAEGRLERVYAGPQWALPPVDRALRGFVRAWRSIPAREYRLGPQKGGKRSPLVVWQAKEKDGCVFFAVNTTDQTCAAEIGFETRVSAGDLVDGGTHRWRKGFSFEVPPFGVAVWRVRGAGEIASVVVPVSAEERKDVQTLHQRFAAMEAEIAALPEEPVEEVRNGGETYFALLSGGEGRLDARHTFQELYAPMKAAFAAGDWNELRRLQREFAAERTWWFEAFGWPEGAAIGTRKAWNESIAYYPQSRGSHMAYPNVFTNQIKTIEKYCDTFIFVPKGVPFTFRQHSSGGGPHEITLNGLFGGGYGDIRVEWKGKALGHIRSTSPETRYEPRRFWMMIPNGDYNTEVTLVSEAEKGMALSRLALPLGGIPKRVTRWKGLGVLPKKGSTNQNHAFFSEATEIETNKIDFAKTWPGLNGQTVAWKDLDNGAGRGVLDLPKLFPCDWTRGDGYVYLAAWIHNPTKQWAPARFEYVADFFSKLWLNGKLLVPEGNGPSNGSRGIVGSVTFNPGWNQILVKVAPGMGGWLYSLAFFDQAGCTVDFPPQAGKK